MRTISVTRYVTPLYEGGSLPAIVEADDLGTYVLKFRGAGQGPQALIAELVSGELARALGLPVPEIVLVELDPVLGRSEPDYEIRSLIQASPGLNLALDYLPGSVGYEPGVSAVTAELAARVVWFDAFVTNVDRTAKNPNLLVWHRALYLIDHGASLMFQHDWPRAAEKVDAPFARSKDHVLLSRAGDLRAADRDAVGLLSRAGIEAIAAQIPDVWLGDDAPALRRAYADHLVQRLEGPRSFVEEAARAQAQL